MRSIPVHTPIMGATTRTVGQEPASKAPAMNVAPEKYIAARKRACSGGTSHGSAQSTAPGTSQPQAATQSASAPTAAKKSLSCRGIVAASLMRCARHRLRRPPRANRAVGGLGGPETVAEPGRPRPE